MASPEIFRRWCGIAAVAGALERRVWAKTSLGVLFPNVYVLLVGPPGVGKYIIETVRELWTETIEPGTKRPAFAVAPDNMSKAALMDTLAKAKKTWLPKVGAPLTYHSLLIAAEEFEVLLPDYDREYIGSLNSIFNNKPLHAEARRHGPVRELVIERPQLTILGGAQPSYFVSTFPEEAWSTGFARRIIMVYAAETPFRELFGELSETAVAKPALLAKLAGLSQLYGQMKWTPDAASALAEWHRKGCPPVPGHSKLAHYNRSRTMHAAKLAIISSASRGPSLAIDALDIKRGIEWLCEAEALMPDIFREMAGKSDSQVIEELHFFMQRAWLANGRKPLRDAMLVGFLAQRLPSEKIEKVLAIAERAGVIARVAGTADQYVPRPRTEHGIE